MVEASRMMEEYPVAIVLEGGGSKEIQAAIDTLCDYESCRFEYFDDTDRPDGGTRCSLETPRNPHRFAHWKCRKHNRFFCVWDVPI